MAYSEEGVVSFIYLMFRTNFMDNEGKFVYHSEMKANILKEEFDSQYACLY